MMKMVNSVQSQPLRVIKYVFHFVYWSAFSFHTSALLFEVNGIWLKSYSGNNLQLFK